MHIFTSDGKHILQHATGHKGDITALSVDFRPAVNYVLATASSDGEVKVWTVQAPDRRGGRGGNMTNAAEGRGAVAVKEEGAKGGGGKQKEGKEGGEEGGKQGGKHGNAATKSGGSSQGPPRVDMKTIWANWQPAFKLDASFFPSSVETVRGISKR